ncbi:MAG TPA: protease SohB [Gammaproteobacteria bacterium]
MSELLADYGLFLAELLTLAIVLIVVFAVLASIARRGARQEGLEVQHLNRRFEESADALKRAVYGKQRYKKEAKARRRERKRAEQARAKDGSRPRTFVIDFKGDLRATAVASLREEVSAVLAIADDGDEVIVRLENSGGTVHEHGLAASQLLRLKQRGLKLCVAVDKVAASGGYLMACVADRIVAAPFAIVGSIGVVAQLPNFHRLLDEKGIDYEMLTAGRYKRTLSLFAKNTEEGRQKLQEEIEDVHRLFKQQIAEHRPQVDIERVATGEHWYGVRALELKLVDEIKTSDDLLRETAASRDLYLVTYKRRKRFAERITGGAETFLAR